MTGPAEMDLGPLRSAIEKIQEIASKIGVSLGGDWQKLVEAVKNPGSPGGLADAADVWQHQVKGDINSSDGELADRVKAVQNHWGGPSEGDFNTFITNLATCYPSLGTACDGIAATLRDTRVNMIIFFSAIGALVISFVAFELLCLAASIESCGASDAAAVAAFPAFLGMVATAVVAFEVFLSSCHSDLGQLQNQLANANGFVNGRWPRPAGAINDPSGGKWQPK